MKNLINSKVSAGVVVMRFEFVGSFGVLDDVSDYDCAPVIHKYCVKKKKTIKQNERKYIKELNTTTNRTRTNLLVLWLSSNRQWNTRTRGSIPKPKNQTDIFIPKNKIVWLVYTKIFIFFFPATSLGFSWMRWEEED